MEDEIKVIEGLPVEIIQTESLSVIMKAEIDMQISTARAYPRSIGAFLKKVQSIATTNQRVAESCTFAVKRAGKTILGPSIRLAEIVVSSYQNARAGARVIANDGRTITSQGIFHDLENNVCVTVEVKRSILQHELRWENGKSFRTGRMITMTDDMQVVTGNAANSIAYRNAVFKGVPAALIEDAYDEIKKVARGDEKSLPERRQKALEFLYGYGVTEQQVCAVLEIHSIEDIDLEKLVTLRGMCNLIKVGENTAAEIFQPEPPAPKEKATDAMKATEDAIKAVTTKAKTSKIEPK